MSTQLRVPLWHVWAVCLSAELLLFFFALCYWSAHPDLTFHTPGSSCGSKLPYPACNNVCLLNCVCVCLFIGWSLCVDVEQVRLNVLASFTECEPLQIPGWCWGFPVLRRATPQTLSIPVMRTIQSNMMWDCGTVDCVTACILSADITPEAHIPLVIKAIRESVSVCVNFISVLFYKWQTHAVTPPTHTHTKACLLKSRSNTSGCLCAAELQLKKRSSHDKRLLMYLPVCVCVQDRELAVRDQLCHLVHQPFTLKTCWCQDADA